MKCLPHHADTYRPSGALRRLGIAWSINISPLWGFPAKCSCRSRFTSRFWKIMNLRPHCGASPLLTFPYHFPTFLGRVFLCWVRKYPPPPTFRLEPANPLIRLPLQSMKHPDSDNPHIAPLGCSWTNRPAIDITPRWSEKQSRFPTFSLPRSLLWGFGVFGCPARL